jgi:hypothetical protein
MDGCAARTGRARRDSCSGTLAARPDESLRRACARSSRTAGSRMCRHLADLVIRRIGSRLPRNGRVMAKLLLIGRQDGVAQRLAVRCVRPLFHGPRELILGNARECRKLECAAASRSFAPAVLRATGPRYHPAWSARKARLTCPSTAPRHTRAHSIRSIAFRRSSLAC